MTAIPHRVVFTRANEDKAEIMTTTQTLTGERADFLQTLAKHRGFLRFTVQRPDR